MSFLKFAIKLGIDATEYTAGLKKAETALTGFGKTAIAGIGAQLAGAFSVGIIAAWTVKVLKATADVADFAEQVGVTTDEFQSMEIAASEAGIEVDKLSGAFAKLRKLQADFKAGDKTAIETFAKTGLNPNQNLFDLARNAGGLSDQKFFQLFGAKDSKAKGALAALGNEGAGGKASEESIRALDNAMDVFAEGARGLGRFIGGIFGSGAARFQRVTGTGVPKEIDVPLGRLDKDGNPIAPITAAAPTPVKKRRPGMELSTLSFDTVPVSDLTRTGGTRFSNIFGQQKEQLVFLEAISKDIKEIKEKGIAVTDNTIPTA